MSNEIFVNALDQNGWCYIPGDYYQASDENLSSLRQGYMSGLILDPYSKGNRYRAYAQCQYREPDSLTFGHFHPYQQTKDYNPDTGGIVREYPIIIEEVLSNTLFMNVIKDDIAFVKRYSHIGNPSDLSIGIHLFRYKATYHAPAFSSPVWLHRDDEDVVFVHLVNRSDELIGGDNVIAVDAKNIETVFRLENPMDTFVVNHKKLHAITPIGHAKEMGFSFRDIILVTFQKMETAIPYAHA